MTYWSGCWRKGGAAPQREKGCSQAAGVEERGPHYALTACTLSVWGRLTGRSLLDTLTRTGGVLRAGPGWRPNYRITGRPARPVRPNVLARRCLSSP